MRRAARELVEAVEELVELVDPVEAELYDASAVAMLVSESARWAARIRDLLSSRVLLWLARNAAAEREIIVGEVKYFGERDKKVKVRDMPLAVGALFAALEARKQRQPERYGEPLLAALGGDDKISINPPIKPIHNNHCGGEKRASDVPVTISTPHPDSDILLVRIPHPSK